MDISRTGIRIRLNKPLNKVLNNYSDENHHTQKSIDDMLFQCVKLYDSIFLIKPSS